MLEVVSKRSSQIKAVWHLTLHKLRHDSTSNVLKHCAQKLWQLRTSGRTESAFDREFGTDTAGTVSLWKLHIQSPNHEQGFRYQASEPDFVRTAIEKLPIRTDEYVFIDIGSGKGLTLLVASEYPFRRVLGIEFSAELHSVAAENIRKHRSSKRKCNDVVSIFADAATYEFPIENMVLFLYNPFGENVLRRMLENLKASLVQSDREVYVIYSNPICIRLLDETDFLERIEAPTDAAIYRHTSKFPKIP